MKKGRFALVKSVQEQEFEKAQKLEGPRPDLAPNRLLQDLFGHP